MKSQEPVHDCDHGNGKLFDRKGQVLPGLAVRLELGRAHPAHPTDVRSGNERPIAGTGDDHSAHRGIWLVAELGNER